MALGPGPLAIVSVAHELITVLTEVLPVEVRMKRERRRERG
jgi:hypothetical protein